MENCLLVETCYCGGKLAFRLVLCLLIEIVSSCIFLWLQYQSSKRKSRRLLDLHGFGTYTLRSLEIGISSWPTPTHNSQSVAECRKLAKCPSNAATKGIPRLMPSRLLPLCWISKCYILNFSLLADTFQITYKSISLQKNSEIHPDLIQLSDVSPIERHRTRTSPSYLQLLPLAREHIREKTWENSSTVFVKTQENN